MNDANSSQNDRPLKILILKDRYPTRFMTPHGSRHNLVAKPFAPLDKLSDKLDGVTLLAPSFNPDFTHAFNRIPIGASKLLMSFESHLPRAFALTEGHPLLDYMRRRIAKDSCRRIIAMSRFAVRCFEAQNAGCEGFDAMQRKMIVRYPNLDIVEAPDRLDLSEDGPLKLCFVGGHFARKGGCVAVKLAERALAQDLPIEITIISSLEMGGAVWTDPTREAFYEPYLKLLELPNVRHLGAQPNAVVQETFAQSHFSLLPTFSDTFGYSVVEGMANWTPAITTNVCALPEFVFDGFNGLTVELPHDATGGWAGFDYSARGSEAYEKRFADSIEDLADQIAAKLQPVLNDRSLMAPMRKNARKTVEVMFDAKRRVENWDAFYDRIHLEPTRSEAVADMTADPFAPGVSEIV